METNQRNSILDIPLSIKYKGKDYSCKVTGRVHPFSKYFTCRIPGANIVVLEAQPKDKSGNISWKVTHGIEFGYLVPFIGKEIEKYIKCSDSAA